MLATLVCAAAMTAAPPEWESVRAILETRCLRCHSGPHAKGELQLANAATLAHGGSRGAAIDPDNLEASRLLSVVDYRNPDLAMPPSGKLPADEIAIIRAWVLAGAPWPEGDEGQLADAHVIAERGAIDLEQAADWWAYRPLDRPPVPQVEDAAWSEHPIDAFVRAEIDERGLQLPPPSSDDSLRRRAAHDLTGLPPAVHGLGDEPLTDDAWDELVDQLLDSPHYGEHWGRHWLDLVRYAETNGYERDGTKTNMWRYRDWVIRALNADMPYDEFILHQLAGDEVEGEHEIDPRLATGFYRLGVWDDEPADAPQALADEIADIVDTTGQVFMGTTVGCARCHDHKADPITQADYYALTAIFNNVKGYGGGVFGQHLGGGLTTAIADPPGPGVMTTGERDAAIARVDDSLAPLLAMLEREAGPPPTAVSLVGDAREGTTTWRYTTEPVDGWPRSGFDDTAWMTGAGGFGTPGIGGATVGTEWGSEVIALRTRFGLTEIPPALILSFRHDEEIQVFLNGALIFQRHGYRNEYQEIQLGQEAVDALVVGSNVLAVFCRNTSGNQFIDVGLRSGWLGDDDRAARHRFAAHADRHLNPASAAFGQELLSERERLATAPVAEPYPAQLIAEHGSDAPEQYVHLRGSVHAPGERVEPGVPAVFAHTAGAQPSFPQPQSGAPTTGRRSAFARWLVEEGRFITARVMANRLWQFHFGRGLSRSPGDFGHLGIEPTHPALLDHLALELIERDWSLKAMHRYIMSSRTYRLSGVVDDDTLAADPRNDWFARFPPQRLTAEQYRDSVLAATGELNLAVLGPSVFPPMAPEVLATASRPGAAWGRSSPEDSARRSVYVFVKRSLRPPLMEALDQPDPDMPCPERFPTNVPTQALMTLNGDFTHTQAARFADRLIEEETETASRIERGIRIALGRSANPEEVERHEAFVQSLRDDHGASEHEALRLFCLALYNLNEFMWID